MMNHKRVSEMTANGYLSVRRQQWWGAEPQGQRSLFATCRLEEEQAKETHGKLKSKGMINLVKTQSAKCRCVFGWTPKPKWYAIGRRCCSITVGSSIRWPGKSASLKVLKNVKGRELGKPVVSRNDVCGIRTVRDGDDAAGRGCQRKQMPFCNETDRRKSSCDENLRPKGSPLLAGLVEREILNFINSE